MRIRFVNRKMRRSARDAIKRAWYEKQWERRYEAFERAEFDRYEAVAEDRYDEAWLGYTR